MDEIPPSYPCSHNPSSLGTSYSSTFFTVPNIIFSIFLYSRSTKEVTHKEGRCPAAHHLQKPVNPNLCWVVLCCKNGFMGICQCIHHDGVGFRTLSGLLRIGFVISKLLYNIQQDSPWRYLFSAD